MAKINKRGRYWQKERSDKKAAQVGVQRARAEEKQREETAKEHESYEHSKGRRNPYGESTKSRFPKFDEMYFSTLHEAKKSKNKNIFHSWATHVVHRECAEYGIGEVLGHTLNKQGNVHFFDVKFGDRLISNIPSQLLEKHKGKRHKHWVQIINIYSMTLEGKILKNSTIRQKNLLRPAGIAAEKPDTGVTINKRGAYFLIRDCADVTLKYAAHLAYSSFNSPLTQLRGKFTQAEIIDFVGRSKEEAHTRQLLHIVLTDIGSAQYKSATDNPVAPIEGTTIPTVSHDYTIKDDEDVYGDYEFDDDDNLSSEPITVEAKDEVNVDDVTAVINKLIEVFQAK